MIGRTLRVLACVLVPLCLVPGAALAADATPTADVAPAAPGDLNMSATGATVTLPAGSWIRDTSISLRFQVAAAGLTPQVEVEPSNVAFTGTANYSGAALAAPGTAAVKVNGLQNGKTYHWQARVVDATGLTSPWVQFGPANSKDVGVDETPPT
ncbi:MAG TPA: fibronectin type III domain-containing protein, partial [Chloroflexota bacterium]